MFFYLQINVFNIYAFNAVPVAYRHRVITDDERVLRRGNQAWRKFGRVTFNGGVKYTRDINNRVFNNMCDAIFQERY